MTYFVLDGLKALFDEGRIDELNALNLPPSLRYLIEHMDYRELWEMAMQDPFAIKVRVADDSRLNAAMQFTQDHPNATSDELREFMRRLNADSEQTS